MRLNLEAAALLSGLVVAASCVKSVPTTDRGLLVPENPNGNITLDISNQDRSVDPLEVQVLLDGVPIIRAKIAIGEVHPSYERYRFDWAPGTHEIRVESTSVAAKLVATVEVSGERFLGVLYGYPPKAGEFVLTNYDEPTVWR